MTINKNGATTREIQNFEWKNFVAGMAGGAAATAIFHPLDLIKIRWQVYEAASLKLLNKNNTTNGNNITSQGFSTNAPVYRPKYKSLFDTISHIYKSEKGITGLYRGFTINTVASGSAWGIYFLIYNGLKNNHLKNNPHLKSDQITVAFYTLYATMASVITISITNPLFLIKTRMCLQYNQQSLEQSTSKVVKYKNSYDAFYHLLKSEGFVGLYRGIVPGLFGTLNGTIQMVCYEKLKVFWLSHLKRKAKKLNSQDEPKLETFHFSTFSSLSKFFAVVCTYPFQLMRSRLQDQHQSYKNLKDVIFKTYKNEKLYGFYKGLIPALIRVVPAASVTFIVYENLLQFLNNH
jgi:solute carrier family 25 folate transporter 32